MIKQRGALLFSPHHTHKHKELLFAARVIKKARICRQQELFAKLLFYSSGPNLFARRLGQNNCCECFTTPRERRRQLNICLPPCGIIIARVLGEPADAQHAQITPVRQFAGRRQHLAPSASR
jgi:hypothetical protein